MHSPQLETDALTQRAIDLGFSELEAAKRDRDQFIEMAGVAMARAERAEAKLSAVIEAATDGLERAHEYARRATNHGDRMAAECGALQAVVEIVIATARGAR